MSFEPGAASRVGGHTDENISGSLRANMGDNQTAVVYALDRASFNQGENAKYKFEISEKGINSTLVSKGASAVAYKLFKWIVRRLTPLECERLQGYPDGWTIS